MIYADRLPIDFETWNEFHDWILTNISKQFSPYTFQYETPEVIDIVEYGGPKPTKLLTDEAFAPQLGVVSKTKLTYSLIDVERKALAELKEAVKQQTFNEDELQTICWAFRYARGMLARESDYTSFNRMDDRLNKLLKEERKKQNKRR